MDVRASRRRARLLAAGLVGVIGCDRVATPPAPSTADPTQRSESPAEQLAREGFAALRMTEGERASIAAAGDESDWTRLPIEAFPPRLRRFHGVEARIEGWMIPGAIERSRVLDFMLVRENEACCFGAMPADDEWIQVVMDDGTHASYLRYAKVAVHGVLELGGPAAVEGLPPPALRMRANRCEIIEKPR